MTVPDDQRPLADVVAAAECAHGRIDVARDDEPVAAVVSAAYLSSREETIAIGSDPDLVAAIADGEAELASGQAVSLDEVMTEFGLK